MINTFFRNVISQPALKSCFGIKVDGVELFPSSFSSNLEGERLHITLKYSNQVTEDIFIARNSWNSCTATRRLRNSGDKVLNLNEIFLRLEGITFGNDPKEDYFYHLENPRMYVRYCIGVDEDHFQLCRDSGYDPVAGNRWSDPGTIHKRVGRSPYQPFPAILLSNMKSDNGVVHGTLSQKVFYHCYELDHDDKGRNTFAIFSAFKAIDYRELAPGEMLTDEWYLGTTEEAGNIQKIFSDYSAVLRKKLQANYGKTGINRYSMVWGSWNDGIFRNIHADQLIKTAKYIKENFPTVEWMQIDDGYAAWAGKLERAHGLGMGYEGADGIDFAKFPEGMTAFYNKVREIGLRPAIWVGGLCPRETPVFQEHPEWFADYGVRIKHSSPLDVSKPEAREFMERALDVLLTEFGCEGMKHDFWSYAFEEGSPLLSGHKQSGYELRRWWLQSIRKRLAEDGYLQTGCDIVMNNPFLGEYFTNYRYGIDIGHGDWVNVKTTFLWGAACFATHTGDLFVPNSDSVGVFPGLTDDEALFCINFCLATGSMVEISGFLDTYDGNPRMKYLRKAVCCPNNGQEIFLAGLDYRTSDEAPDKFFFKGPFFSLERGNANLPLRTIGFFNLEDDAKKIAVSTQELELPAGKYLAWDIWAGKAVEFEDSFAVDTAAHGSALYSIIPVNGEIQLLDCDLKVTGAEKTANGLAVSFAFAGKAVVNYFDGKEIKSVEFESAAPGDVLILEK